MAERKLNNKDFKELYNAFLLLEKEEECKKFLRDICSVSELSSMVERLQVAKQINANVPYRQINKNTGVSTATITRVAHWLRHGMGGYKLIINKM